MHEDEREKTECKLGRFSSRINYLFHFKSSFSYIQTFCIVRKRIKKYNILYHICKNETKKITQCINSRVGSTQILQFIEERQSPAETTLTPEDGGGGYHERKPEKAKANKLSLMLTGNNLSIYCRKKENG